ncbi:uncharacterized protein TRAVEDRAFT_24770 [Trametes versicolor FP-101664 SS1]|uniref:Secreted protein n=1 Tax=Trametes versicolor (strain FP-101664) TaxID=717944 RepID=R7S7S3_TRAVS|nr:uncharacterized protein TRAVEDRAFT_24770 [Trametes versicolor FP-101664 SS1]EIW52088.1 hypothetical protein TRAVEDRAFT_24770 [Trametes versicolor FP-101664 SS1]
MFSRALTVVIGLAVCTLAGGPFAINEPDGFTQCVPTLITWSGGEGPFILVIQSGGNREPVEEFPNIPAGSTDFLWQTNVLSRTLVSLELVDSTGEVAETGLFLVQPGTTRGSDTCGMDLWNI